MDTGRGKVEELPATEGEGAAEQLLLAEESRDTIEMPELVQPIRGVSKCRRGKEEGHTRQERSANLNLREDERFDLFDLILVDARRDFRDREPVELKDK